MGTKLTQAEIEKLLQKEKENQEKAKQEKVIHKENDSD